MVAAGLLGGCATPEISPLPPASSPAHLTVINETDYEWRLEVRRAAGTEAGDFHVEARATMTADFPPGDYVIEQTALSGSGEPALSRHLPIRFSAGQNYRWRLGTLLSEPGASGARP